MMSESPKAELIFEYTRGEDGMYTGSVELLEPGTGESLRPPFFVVVQRPEWVRFVVDTIRSHADVDLIAFNLRKPDRTKYRYQLDRRTIERIKDSSLAAEDLIL
jgi:hypothetical protein